MTKISTITLIGDRAMFHSPQKKEESQNIRNAYGWSGEDYRQAVINPDIQDAIPKQEDFLPFMFRHITATIVGAGSWKATDFSKPGVLKKAKGLFEYKPVYVNHEWEVSNAVGGIGQTKYTEAFTASDGTKIPAGIDAPIFIDGKLHADICRKLQAFPVPTIQSVSVSVLFEWEPSHVFTTGTGEEDEWLFESRIGTMVDGKMVCRVVTKILEAYETSLVWLGADPFAKILNEKGEPLNVEKSAVVGLQKFDKDPLAGFYKTNNRYFVYENCFNSDKQLNLHKANVINFNKSEKLSTMDFQQILAVKLGVDKETLTEEMLNQYSIVKTDVYTKEKANSEKLASVQTELTKANGDVAKLTKIIPLDKVEAVTTSLQEFGENTTVETLIPLAKYGNETLTAKRQLCEKHYKLSVGENNEDQAVIDIISNATDKQIDGLLKQYGVKNIGEFGGTCKSCGSTEITFRTTVPEEEKDSPDKTDAQFDMPNGFRK